MPLSLILGLVYESYLHYLGRVTETVLGLPTDEQPDYQWLEERRSQLEASDASDVPDRWLRRFPDGEPVPSVLADSTPRPTQVPKPGMVVPTSNQCNSGSLCPVRVVDPTKHTALRRDSTEYSIVADGWALTASWSPDIKQIPWRSHNWGHVYMLDLDSEESALATEVECRGPLARLTNGHLLAGEYADGRFVIVDDSGAITTSSGAIDVYDQQYYPWTVETLLPGQ